MSTVMTFACMAAWFGVVLSYLGAAMVGSGRMRFFDAMFCIALGAIIVSGAFGVMLGVLLA